MTALFKTRQVDQIATIEVLGPNGEIETLSGTTIHPIWSIDRQDWVELGELQEGECLQAADGEAVVLSVTIHQLTTPVYNIEVHGEHVYQVGDLKLLVHNSALDCVRIGINGEILAGTLGQKVAVRSLLNPTTWRFPDKIDDAAKIIYETKNVKYQHLSTQLRDYVAIAQSKGYQLVLNIRSNTTVSSALQTLFDNGTIIPNRIL